MIVVLLGAPGSGKGTQAKILAAKLGLLHLSTGDVLRRNVAENTELGALAVPFMNAGKYVPDDLINSMVEAEIDAPAAAKGVIFDGYPRTLNQAQALDALLESKNRPIDYVINLEIDPEALVVRLGGRRVCRNCGQIYHLVSQAPAKPGVCDTCSVELYQRDDDKEETIRTRQKVYTDQTAPLLKYYDDRGHMLTFDAAEGIDTTAAGILAALEGAV